MSELVPLVGVAAACRALGVSRATWYRRRSPARTRPPKPRTPHPFELSSEERAAVIGHLNAEALCDMSVREAWATLLDDGIYLCSISTMYRLLRRRGEVRERRRHARHPTHVKPELVARAPNQVWSWDITKLLGPEKWTWYYLYVILDVFSRKVVGWTLAPRESAGVAEALINETLGREGVARGQLTIHADRGSSMTSKPVAFLLADLGVTRSHSRPHQSNDNPYSESQFKTMKYRPDFPGRFANIQAARAFAERFFDWYNREHHHCGIGLHTPDDVHAGRAGDVRRRRAAVLEAAYRAHPERFRAKPQPPKLPTVAWINQPPEVIITK